MSVKVKGNMWCESCQRSVAGQKSTKKAIGLGAFLLSGGLWLEPPGTFHCPVCGQSVVPMWTRKQAAPAASKARASTASAARPSVSSGSRWVADIEEEARAAEGAGDTRKLRSLAGRADNVGVEAGQLLADKLRRKADHLESRPSPNREQDAVPSQHTEQAVSQTDEHERPSGTTLASELGQLADLRRLGALTEEEFARAKTKLLGP